MRVLVAPTLGEARRALAEFLDDQPALVIDTAQLLASEIITNAILHGGGAQRVTLQRSPTQLCVEVFDENAALPIVRRVGAQEPNGRGMFLVDTLSSSWLAQACEGGKVVSFEMNLRP